MPDDPNDLRKLFSNNDADDEPEASGDTNPIDMTPEESPEVGEIPQSTIQPESEPVAPVIQPESEPVAPVIQPESEPVQPSIQPFEEKDETWETSKRFGMDDPPEDPGRREKLAGLPRWASGLSHEDDASPEEQPTESREIVAEEPREPVNIPEKASVAKRMEESGDESSSEMPHEISALRDVLFSSPHEDKKKKKKQKPRYIEPQVEANPLTSFVGLIGAICVGLALLMGLFGYTAGIGMMGLTGIGVFLLIVYSITNRRNLKLLLSARSTRYGTNVILVVVSLFSMLILGNAISADNYLVYDVTSDKLNTLSDQTLNLLSELDSSNAKVTATVFIPRESKYRVVQDNVEEMLSRYAYHFPDLEIEYLDPDVHRQKAEELSFSEAMGIVFEMGEESEKAVEFEIDSRQWIYEGSMTAALLRLTGGHTMRIYFLTGHGELVWDDYASGSYKGAGLLAQELIQAGFQVEKLSFSTGAKVPADCSLLIIPGPTKTVSPKEVAAVKSYIDTGGKVILLLEARMEAGFSGMLSEFGITYHANLIADNVNNLHGSNNLYPVLDLSNHPVNLPLRNANREVVFFRASSLETENLGPGKEAEPLLRTQAGGSWAETGDGDIVELDPVEEERGPFTMAVMAGTKIATDDVEPEQEGEESSDDESSAGWGLLLAAGDASFIANANLETYGNRDFMLNAVDFMTSDEAYLTLRPADTRPRLQLTKTQVATAFIVTSAILPLLIAAMGVIVWFRRR